MRWLVLLLLPTVAAGPLEYVLDGEPSPEGLTALGAWGVDAKAVGWYGHVAVPENGADPIVPLRALLAVATTGYPPEAYPDPVRGSIDIQAQLRANLPAALASQNDAVWSFQTLAMLAAGMPTADVAPLVHRLGSGPWGCGGAVSPDCTGFAVAALAAAGRLAPVQEGLLAYLDGTVDSTCAFGTPANTQSTAWALVAYRAMGAVRPCTLESLRDARNSDGGFPWSADSAHSDRWATTDVLLALGRFPTLPYAPLAIEATRPTLGQTVMLRADKVAEWRVGEEELHGASVSFRPTRAGVLPVYAVSEEGETLGRASLELMVEPRPPPSGGWVLWLIGLALAKPQRLLARGQRTTRTGPR